jgi:hypothetical protein
LTTRFIAETKWRVQLQTGAPTLQNFEQVLDAPSQEVAIHRAQQRYPNVQFISVTASQVDPQTGGPAQQQNTQTPTGAGQLPPIRPLSPLRGLTPLWPQNQQQQQQPVPETALPLNPRRFFFPYSISLPPQFYRLLQETSPVSVIDNNGHYSIVLENEQEMRRFLVKLNAHHDRLGVDTLLAGIRSSLT